MNQTSHAYRFLKCLAGRWVFCPCFSQIFRYGNSPASSSIITHIQHQYSRFYFRHLRFRCIGSCHIVHFPCFPPVFTIHDSCIRNTGRVYKLRWKYQCAITHRYSTSGTLKQEVPGRIFHLLCYIDRLRPGFTIVCAFSQY